jgi:hypothetical protein
MPLKGQSFSQESIRKMVESKKAQTANQYNWIIVEPYLDIVIQNGSSNRKNKFITLREFRNNISSGISTKEMVRQGISKHLLQFFSNFCQGKIKVTKDEMNKLYEDGQSLDEISKKNNITRENLTYLRQLYDIKRKGATFIHRKETEEPITERQKEIIYGCLMGDGKKQHSQSFASLGIGQCDKQKEYVLWKYIELQNITSPRGVVYTKPINDGREEYKNSSGIWGFYTKANSDIEKIIKDFYSSGKKQITNDILKNLTPLSIAVWFMDDGGGDMSKKTRDKHPNWNMVPEFYFCTDSFLKDECEIIIQWFLDTYNIKTHLRYRRRGSTGQDQYRIIINNESSQDFIDLVSPHILPCMRYKIDYNAYLNKIASEKNT